MLLTLVKVWFTISNLSTRLSRPSRRGENNFVIDLSLSSTALYSVTYNLSVTPKPAHRCPLSFLGYSEFVNCIYLSKQIPYINVTVVLQHTKMTVLRHVHRLFRKSSAFTSCVLVTTKTCHSLASSLVHNQPKFISQCASYRPLLINTFHDEPFSQPKLLSTSLTSPFCCSHRNLSTTKTTAKAMANTAYTIEERGARNSLDYRVYFSEFFSI